MTSYGNNGKENINFWQVCSPYPSVTFSVTTTGDTEMKKANPYVPDVIHVNEQEKIMVVKWSDGTENKVTCDDKDNFSVELGFAMALTQKIFYGKSQFKEKWWKIISRRIKYHENGKPIAVKSVVVDEISARSGKTIRVK